MSTRITLSGGFDPSQTYAISLSDGRNDWFLTEAEKRDNNSFYVSVTKDLPNYRWKIINSADSEFRLVYHKVGDSPAKGWMLAAHRHYTRVTPSALGGIDYRSEQSTRVLIYHPGYTIKFRDWKITYFPGEDAFTIALVDVDQHQDGWVLGADFDSSQVYISGDVATDKFKWKIQPETMQRIKKIEEVLQVRPESESGSE